MVILGRDSSKPLEVLVLDRNPILGVGLCRLLSEDSDLVATSRSAITTAELGLQRTERPDVIVIDPEQIDLLASDLVSRLTFGHEGVTLIGYSASTSVELARACFKAGFRGFLPKTTNIETMRRAILVIANGGVYLDDAYAVAMSGAKDAKRAESDGTLSNRELYVLKLVAHGKTLKEIASEMNLSAKTVDTYKSRGASKLNLGSRQEIVQYAIKHGWMQLQH